jgi:2-phospho-L-lactate/phosphoenolpyruvate guanylyltransferase
VQASVATWDPESGAGTALLDDGTPVAFPGTAFEASGLLLLRLGQRLRLEYGPDGTVVLLSLVTLPGEFS